MHPAATATGAAARALAARLAEHGYRVTFLSRCDPTAVKLNGPHGAPDIEVIAVDNGPTACHCTGSGLAEAAAVIARLPLSGYPAASAGASDTVIAAREGVEIEWHYLASPGQPVGLEQVAAALLAHLSLLAAWVVRHDAAPAAGARGTTHG